MHKNYVREYGFTVRWGIRGGKELRWIAQKAIRHTWTDSDGNEQVRLIPVDGEIISIKGNYFLALWDAERLGLKCLD